VLQSLLYCKIKITLSHDHDIYCQRWTIDDWRRHETLSALTKRQPTVAKSIYFVPENRRQTEIWPQEDIFLKHYTYFILPLQTRRGGRVVPSPSLKPVRGSPLPAPLPLPAPTSMTKALALTAVTGKTVDPDTEHIERLAGRAGRMGGRYIVWTSWQDEAEHKWLTVSYRLTVTSPPPAAAAARTLTIIVIRMYT